MTRIFLRIVALGAVLGGLAGCLAPTLPLPPPLTDALTAPDDSGFVVVSGEVRPRAFVSILNTRTDEGVIARADGLGRFSTRIRAISGDALMIYQIEGTLLGTSILRTVPGAGSVPDDGGMRSMLDADR